MSRFYTIAHVPHFLDDVIETEQRRPIQKRGLPGAGSPSKHEEIDPFPAAGNNVVNIGPDFMIRDPANTNLSGAGEARQHAELLPQHHCQRHEEVSPQDPGRNLRCGERGRHLQHHQDGGGSGAGEGRAPADDLAADLQPAPPRPPVRHLPRDRLQLRGQRDQHDGPGARGQRRPLLLPHLRGGRQRQGGQDGGCREIQGKAGLVGHANHPLLDVLVLTSTVDNTSHTYSLRILLK